MLPCLPLKNGEKFQWQAKPDSLADLVERYGNAGVAREKRARRNNHVQWQTGSYPYEADRFAPSRSESPGSSAEGGFETEEDLNYWMQQEFEREERTRAVNASARKRAHRSLKERIVHTPDSAHGLLHRSAEETRRAFNAQEGVVFSTDSGETKSGPELENKDLEFGKCNVCKQLRAVAPTRNKTGATALACGECATKGATFSSE